MKTLFLSLIIYCISIPVFALELFEQSLLESDAEDFKAAITARGYAQTPGGVTDVYTTFSVDALFPGAQELYVGTDKENGKVAFIEYCIDPKARWSIHEVLTSRYGGALEVPGRYYADSMSVWRVEKIQIQLTQYPKNPCLSLSYAVNKRLKALRDIYSNDDAIEVYPKFAM